MCLTLQKKLKGWHETLKLKFIVQYKDQQINKSNSTLHTTKTYIENTFSEQVKKPNEAQYQNLRR